MAQAKPNLPAITAAAQAIAGVHGLHLSPGNQSSDNPLNNTHMIRLAATDAAKGREPLRYMRGQADLAALSLRHHNTALHSRHRPADPKAASVYDALELMRVELLGAQTYDGLKHNLEHRMDIHCQLQGYAQITQSADAPISDIIALLLREKMTDATPPPAIADLVKLWRPWAEREAASLQMLADNLHDQQRFNAQVMELLQQLDLLQTGEASPGSETESDEEPTNTDSQQMQEDQEDESTPSPSPPTSEEPSEEPTMREEEEGDGLDATQEQEEQEQPHHLPNRPTDFDQYHAIDYAIFTTQFDEVVDAHSLASDDELRHFRTILDEQLKKHPAVHTRLAAKLTRLLMAQRLSEWVYDLEDGMIDNARLSRVIVHPDVTTIYKTEHDSTFRDTVVSLLIDNSGSMRGRPITIAALSVDILARTLERCGVKVEILGFTTRDWKGGRSRKAWEDAGRPPYPGRLNDLRHIIYKAADARLHVARRNLGLMLKDGLLKENIDGEALWWAYSRLLKRHEQRRILLVISDGAPVDDATLSSNSSGYLDRHLRDVIALIEHAQQVELLAIGIGHDVTRYYAQALTINDIDQLGDVMLKEMTRLFSS
jgi:cobaltochelatase CobT